MCSVFGYIGKNKCKNFVMEGLHRLEYRGYDSAGFACLEEKTNKVLCEKAEGRLSNLQEKLKKNPIDGFIGIGHTRWATHGMISEKNAHPQFDCEQKISIVHNGIIENCHELKKRLSESGHVFESATDTEVVAHLFEALLVSHTSLKATVIDLIKHLEGAFAFICIMKDFPDTMLLVRKRSPLCIGIDDNQMFVASDSIAFAGKTKKVLFIPDESFAIVTKDLIELYDFTGKSLPLDVQEFTIDWTAHEKDDHEHFMLKEIYEQKEAIHATIKFLRSINNQIWDHLSIDARQIEELDRIHLIGSGTSWHAARIAKFFFEQIVLIQTQVHLSSEFRYMSFFPERNSLYFTISQSGETADTLEALRLIKSMDLNTATITNVASSSMVREADGFLLTQAGFEFAVASTKAFSTQVAALYWLAHRFALEKGIITQKTMRQTEEDLLVTAEVLENSIENYKYPIIQKHSKEYAKYKKAIFLGRHISYPFAMEAALKLKEISYVFAQCYPAGELKHGPLALVDPETPVFIFSHQDPLIYRKLVSNAQEAKARGGKLVAFIFEGQNELGSLADLAFITPKVKPLLGPLAMTGLMQFFFYQIAQELGCPIDKPRNLAKSVTVE